MTKFTNSALAQGKPVIPINQCMNWRVLAGRRDVFRSSPVAQLRFPNEAELRYWCYSAAAQGVRGMFWWSYYRSIQSSSRWINNDFAKISREFRKFTLVTAPTHKPQIYSRARDTDVIIALWQRPQGNYLVVVNSRPVERNISCQTDDTLANAELTVWGSTRRTHTTLKNNQLIVRRAKPWEVFVWKLRMPSTQ